MDCPPSGVLVPEFSDPGSFGPLSHVRRKKRLCHLMSSNYLMKSVTILAPNKKHSHLCELPNRVVTCIGHKRVIMVKPLTKPKEETDGDVDMAPPPEVDYGAADDGPPEPQPDNDKGNATWRFPIWGECEEILRESIKKEGVHPVDPITIASKSDPIPLKDLRDTWLREHTDGWYGGHPIRDTLLADEFDTIIDGVPHKVCRWAVNFIDETKEPGECHQGRLKGTKR